MTAIHNTREERLNRTQDHATAAVNVAPDDGWMATLSKISPILGGVGTFGSFINSVISARGDAEAQKALIAALQTIQADLESIKNDLNAILETLKDIEIEIRGLELDDKLTSIETWGEEMGALKPDDEQGRKNLATAMMSASHGATNLLGCMIGLHNALVGISIGKPLITLLDAQGFLQIRARLIQGLQLLAFACAFNQAEEYDYGVFLHSWAANFQQELQNYLAAGKDRVPEIQPDPGREGETIAKRGDTVAVLCYAQPSLPNVALSVVGKAQTMLLYTGTLGYTAARAPQWPALYSFMEPTAPPKGFVDVINDEVSTDPNSPLAKKCDPETYPNQYLKLLLNPLLNAVTQGLFTAKAMLVCGARFDPNQTFLGAVNGQLAWVEAAEDKNTYTCSIHDGDNTTAPLLTYDATKGSVTAQPFDKLTSLTPAVWTVTWVAKNAVTISAVQSESSPSSQTVYLSLDPGKNWIVTPSKTTLNVTAAPANGAFYRSPLQMPLTPASIQSTVTSTERTVLFHQL
jgi:hypothetical protein